MAGRRPERLQSFAYVGCERYFLTMCCEQRRARFTDDRVADAVRTQLLRTSELQEFAVLAYVLMPDHLHALIEGRTDRADLRRWAISFRKWATLAVQRFGVTPLWQEGYHERVLRPTDDPHFVARYILENPVRAGLVDTPGAYPLSWSAFEDFDT